MPMRWVLPGGATPGGRNHWGNERPVACRPRTAVLERTISRRADLPAQTEVNPTAAAGPVPDSPGQKPIERLFTVKLFLEVLAVLVGMIGAILALLGGSRK